MARPRAHLRFEPLEDRAVPAVAFSRVFSYDVGGSAAAEISAFDPASDRLFVLNAEAGATRVEILSLAAPATPVDVGDLTAALITDAPAFVAGIPNSVATSNGLVAVAFEAAVRQNPGRVALFTAATGVFVASYPVGAVPDMVTFTPNGMRLLVANEGEPNSYNQPTSVDPEGSVSVITLTAPGAGAGASVATATFTAFNGQEAALRAQGIRIFGPNATAAQDLEPESIAVSPDSTTAYVTLQENNAVAVVNLSTATVTELRPLGLKDYSQNIATVRTYDFDAGALPTVGTTAPSPTFPQGQAIKLGGFSGLFYEGTDPVTGNLKFITHTDRGPNGEPTNLLPAAGNERPFALPNFQPRLVRFELNQTTGAITLTGQILLTRADGSPLTGRPNLQSGAQGTPYTDEIPIDLFGNQLPNDPLGADLEGVVVAPDGTFWMVDEYRPAIYHFDATGKLIERFVPQGTAAAAGQPAGTFGTEALPAVLGQFRRANRGFEAVAFDPAVNKLYAFVQTTLDNPNTSTTGVRDNGNVRVVEFDVGTKTVTAQYVYVMRDTTAAGLAKTDKIGDAVALGGGKFLVVERDDRTGADSNKLVYEIDLAGATNITALPNPLTAPAAVAGQTIEELNATELAAAGIVPVKKTLAVNAASVGYTGVSKLEGLARIDATTFALLNDNDFGVFAQAIAGDGTVPLNPNPEPIRLGLLSFATSNGLDASDRDLGPAFSAGRQNIQKWPVLGMYMPDAIATYAVGGKTYYVTANEGDARDYTGFNEEIRVGAGGYVLDPAVFPNAATLKLNQNLGRLTVTTASGNTDGDPAFEQIHTFGARSFSVWDAATGARVSDSGDALEQLTALLGPARFNSDGTAASFDGRSDNKGPEPEAVAIGVIDGRTYAFVGLERFGGVAVFDVTDPVAPRFTDYLDTPGDVAPEGLFFLSAADSPTGRAAVVVSNEVSGTVTMYDARPGAYTLQLLHASDLEPGIAAGDDAPRFAAVVDYLERDLFAAADPRKQAFAGSVLLSSGDNFIAGPFYAASGDPSLNGVLNSNPSGVNGDVASPGRAGVEIMNRIGFDASALGNHEFDQGQRELRNIIQPQAGQTAGTNAPVPARQWRGATFPYLSANLAFAGTDLSGSVAAGGVSTTGLAAGRIAPSAIIDADGDGPGTEFVGVIGITTPLLASISSPGNVGVSPAGATGNLTPAQLQQLAGIVQAQVTVLQTLGIDKIVLLSHLQQFSEEQALAGLLRGVDVIIAGGSDTRLADGTDVLRAGDTAEGPYPVTATGADGNPLLLVSTDGNFSYVGRIVLTFDANGVIQTNALNAAVNGAYSADQAGVERLYGTGAVAEVVSTKAAAVKQVTDAIDAVITLKDSTLFGRSEVYLNGLRAEVRTEETNLGNLSADANLLAAQQFDTSTVPTTVSIKNGGGIRDSVGTVDSTTGVRAPTAANADAGKLAGQVSDLDIENALRFNNTLSVVTVTAAQVKLLLEHAVAATAAGATPGQFAQVGGIRYSFDTAGAPLVAAGNTGTGIATFTGGTRVRNAAVVDDAGNVIDVLVQNGAVVGDPTRLVRVVTLSFLVDDGDGNGLGGDNYPFPTFCAQLGNGVFERVNLAEGANPLGEQRAAERYFQQNFPAGGPGFAEADTPIVRDTRVQNLVARSAAGVPDTVLLGLVVPAPVTTAEDTPANTLGVAPTPASGATVTHVRVTNVVGGVLALGDDTLVPPGTFLTVADAAALRFFPTPNFSGAASFQARAATAADPLALVGAVQTVAITVTPVADAPVAAADTYPVAPGSRLTVGSPGVLANDTDVDGDALAAELVSAMTAAEGTVALSANGAFVFTPAAGFVGTTSFTYRVSDGTAVSAPAVVTLTVAAPADPVPALIDPNTGAPPAGFVPFPGANVPAGIAVGDVTGDGTADVITGAGVGGGPVVKVFDGKTGAEAKTFFAYDPSFRGGLTVAVGDVTGDGVADIVTGPGPGGAPHVKVFDGRTGAEVASFFAFDPSFRGGVSVAIADVNADGKLDLVVGAGSGGAPHVKVFDGAGGAELASFFAFDSSFRGGVLVAAGDVDGDGAVEVLAVAGDAGAPRVRTFDSTGREERSFFAFDPSLRIRLTISAADVDGDGIDDIVVGPESGTTPAPRAFDGATGDPFDITLAAVPVD